MLIPLHEALSHLKVIVISDPKIKNKIFRILNSLKISYEEYELKDFDTVFPVIKVSNNKCEIIFLDRKVLCFYLEEPYVALSLFLAVSRCPEIILGFDPGARKTVYVVLGCGVIIHWGVLNNWQVESFLEKIWSVSRSAHTRMVVKVGNGSGWATIIQGIRKVLGNVYLVDELAASKVKSVFRKSLGKGDFIDAVVIALSKGVKIYDNPSS